MKYVVGIDMGSAYSKGIIMVGDRVQSSFKCPSSSDFHLAAVRIRKELFSYEGLEPKDIAYTMATGYGAKRVPFADDTVTDISCHARGMHFLYPSVGTAVDVGDLSSKAFRIDANGNPLKFLQSAKCAGGSGGILRVIATVLHLKVEEMAVMSLATANPVEFNTGCAVFAESEAISRIAEGVPKEDLLAGIYRALAAQVHSLAERLQIDGGYAVTGGGAEHRGFVQAMSEISGTPMNVPEEPRMTAALGAALLAGDRIER